MENIRREACKIFRTKDGYNTEIKLINLKQIVKQKYYKTLKEV